MAIKDEIKPEYKTIRISAGSYYKLVELTGLISALAGYNYSITQIGDGIIAFFYQVWYPELLDHMSSPKKRDAAREVLQERINNWYDALKDVRIKK
ncbi:MAG: hypothetical protein NPMRTH1_580001 [Nitrosopumilales archaeon]|nr:MAG: hypothetical protein NPMRTH1_580001 [Nitrosopumilales archaeon]